MFQYFPQFDRLISWTKPNAPFPPSSREFEWYDWNSLLVDDPADRIGVAEFMDGSSEFPARSEMEKSLAAFADAHVPVRYGCRWESTKKTDDGSFLLGTSDGEYRSKVAVFAVGMTEPWKPPTIPGIEHVLHYMELKPPKEYVGKSIYIIGKGASAFEIADGLLPWASRMLLSSPSDAQPSVVVHSLAGIRARYMQPLEDHAIGGGTVSVLNASTERIERTESSFRVFLKGTNEPWDLTMDFDEAVAATGVSTPLMDLPELGVETFTRGGRLPVQTPFWESPSVPGIYFAGSISQGSRGLQGYGTGAVHGFRYCARLVTGHIAETHFGVPKPRPTLEPEDVVPLLLKEVTYGPELWNQKGVLGRVLIVDAHIGILDEGIVPLTHFVDYSGPDGVAAGVITDEAGTHRPVFYVRSGAKVEEHILESNVILDFATEDHRAQLTSLLKRSLSLT